MSETNEAKNNNSFMMGWSAAGLVIGFAAGYLLLDSLVSGIILGIGLALAMGFGGKFWTKK